MIVKERMINQELNRLRREEMKLVGIDEGELRNLINQAQRRINSDSSISLEDYEHFDASLTTSLYSRFQGAVINRLVAEKKLTSDDAKTWNFETGKTIDKEDSDSSLRLRDELKRARKKTDDKMTEISAILRRINTTLSRGRGDPVEYIKE